jgi:alkanesulfonate monooxygenase SsuD/methylene tetrahydromethanopterin reductase-like flavin-dependent oxidoreductase (luciferase family)
MEPRTTTTNEHLPVGYGVRLPNSGPLATAAGVEAVARQAERCQFDAVWVHDHIPWASQMVTHFSTGSIEACDGQDPNFFETVTSVAFLAGICPGLDVGIAGLVLPLRDPRVLAKQLMTTQVLSRGRLVTALAIGNIPNDFEVMQVPFDRRGSITDDFLGALHQIYLEDRSTYLGENLQFRDAEFFPKPIGARFWIAGNSPPAYRRIARYATGWLPGGLSPAGYRECLDQVEEVLERHERDVAELHRGVELYLCLAASHEEAVRISARSLEHRFSTVENGLDRNIVGGPDAVLERIEAYRRAGVTHFELRIVAHTLDGHVEMLEQFQSDVMPHAATRAAV